MRIDENPRDFQRIFLENPQKTSISLTSNYKNQKITKKATHNLFLGILVRREQINGFHMPEINIMSQEKNEQQLTHIFFLLITVKRFISFKFTSNVGQFFIDTFHFSFFAFAWFLIKIFWLLLLFKIITVFGKRIKVSKYA